MTQELIGLQTNESVRPIYVLPEDPFVQDVLIPSFAASTKVDCMVGFFKSEVLASLAPGLATFINQSEGTFRLVVSPILNADDWAAIETGVCETENVIASMFDDILVTEDAIEKHTLECLSWLLRRGRVEIQIALIKGGLFHPKVWLFHDKSEETLCAHGSTNLTPAGMHRNVEQVAVSTSWSNSDSLYTIQRLDHQFQSFWDHTAHGSIVVPVPQAVREQIVQTYITKEPPQELDTSELYRKATEMNPTTDYITPASKQPKFHIPSWLKYQDGPFAHQGEAIDAWCSNGHDGILEMATGSGKTITAMIAANRLYQEHYPLLIVIAAPYIPLVQQWCDEIEPFGLTPIDLTSANGERGRAIQLGALRRKLRHGNQEVAAVVVSHDTLTSPTFHRQLERFEATMLLIGDEVHGLGSPGFITNPPHFFNYRLGLSATPVRQYDTEGTESLMDFFGPVVYQYSLEQAIGTCLVPYDYFVHPVHLTDPEMEQWHDLTDKIRQNTWRIQEGEQPGTYLQKLLRDRRAIIENAAGKIDCMKEVLQQEDLYNLRHTLIYASDKAPDQLDNVNETLSQLGVIYRQLTHEENRDRKLSRQILKSFQEGDIQVLTAKRVLDEGVNIPQIQKAFILASTTVERQWIQRRGRLLRMCNDIGKTHAEIHDFLAMPPELTDIDKDTRTLITSELNRVQQFANQARNAGLPDGPLSTISKLVLAAYS